MGAAATLEVCQFKAWAATWFVVEKHAGIQISLNLLNTLITKRKISNETPHRLGHKLFF